MLIDNTCPWPHVIENWNLAPDPEGYCVCGAALTYQVTLVFIPEPFPEHVEVQFG